MGQNNIEEIRTIYGSDVISKTYNTINNNFKSLCENIVNLSDKLSSYDSTIGDIKDITSIDWSDDNNFVISYDNGDTIKSSIIPVADDRTCGLLDKHTQKIGGDKIFTKSIYISKGIESGLKGFNGENIITQSGNNVYIGTTDGRGITIKYNEDGTFNSISYKDSKGNDNEILYDTLSDKLNNLETEYNKNILPSIKELKDQSDKSITNWFGDTHITSDNRKSTSESHFTPWTSGSNEEHLSDRYVDKVDKICYTYKKNSKENYLYWEELDADNYPDVIKALLAAMDAKSTADGKQTVYYGVPESGYQFGDIWYVTNEDLLNDIIKKNVKNNRIVLDEAKGEYASPGNILFCNSDYSNSFKITDWGNMINYMNTSILNDRLNEIVEDLLKQSDSTISVYEWNGETENESSKINSPVYKPWSTGEDSEHVGDFVHSKATGNYYEYSKDGENYKWVENNNNILAIMYSSIKELQKSSSNNRNFIIKTRTEMMSDTDHKEGDIWVVKSDSSETVDSRNIYKDFELGGFYLCTDHNHTALTENRGWTLLVDYDSLIEKKINSNESLKNSIKNSTDAINYINNAVNDLVISITEKIQLRKEWYEISGVDGLSVTVDDDYSDGSFGKAYNISKDDGNLSDLRTALLGKFNSLKGYLSDTVKLYTNEHTSLVADNATATQKATAKTDFLKAFSNYYLSEQEIYSKISGIAIEKAKQALENSDSKLTSSFAVEDAVVNKGSSEQIGGLSLTNLLLVKDIDNKITGGISGVSEDSTGLFLGCTYEDAFCAANWDKEGFDKSKYDNIKPNVPVLLTKTGFGSNIGGCVIDENGVLKVPIANIDGEISAKSFSLMNGTTKYGGFSSEDNDKNLWITDKFTVSKDGVLTAESAVLTKADINGNINASSFAVTNAIKSGLNLDNGVMWFTTYGAAQDAIKTKKGGTDIYKANTSETLNDETPVFIIKSGDDFFVLNPLSFQNVSGVQYRISDGNSSSKVLNDYERISEINLNGDDGYKNLYEFSPSFYLDKIENGDITGQEEITIDYVNSTIDDEPIKNKYPNVSDDVITNILSNLTFEIISHTYDTSDKNNGNVSVSFNLKTFTGDVYERSVSGKYAIQNVGNENNTPIILFSTYYTYTLWGYVDGVKPDLHNGITTLFPYVIYENRNIVFKGYGYSSNAKQIYQKNTDVFYYSYELSRIFKRGGNKNISTNIPDASIAKIQADHMNYITVINNRNDSSIINTETQPDAGNPANYFSTINT